MKPRNVSSLFGKIKVGNLRAVEDHIKTMRNPDHGENAVSHLMNTRDNLSFTPLMAAINASPFSKKHLDIMVRDIRVLIVYV